MTICEDRNDRDLDDVYHVLQVGLEQELDYVLEGMVKVLEDEETMAIYLQHLRQIGRWMKGRGPLFFYSASVYLAPLFLLGHLPPKVTLPHSRKQETSC